MADVFRKGRKSVHRAIVSGDPDDPASPNQCRLDGKGNAWLAEQPPGPECVVCFAGLSDDRKSGTGPVQAAPRNARPRTPALALASGALALAFLGGVWASPDMSTAVLPTPYYSASASTASATAGIPSQTPAFSMGPESASPAVSPVGTLAPDPPVVVRVIERRVVIVEPQPTPAPEKVCVHPGNHVGVDACRWPHN